MGQSDVEAAVAVEVRDVHADVGGPAGGDLVMDPGSVDGVGGRLHPETVVGDIEVAVAVEVAEGCAFARAGAGDDLFPGVGVVLQPDLGGAARSRLPSYG